MSGGPEHGREHRLLGLMGNDEVTNGKSAESTASRKSGRTGSGAIQ
jgi:hypothetical protein